MLCVHVVWGCGGDAGEGSEPSTYVQVRGAGKQSAYWVESLLQAAQAATSISASCTYGSTSSPKQDACQHSGMLANCACVGCGGASPMLAYWGRAL